VPECAAFPGIWESLISLKAELFFMRLSREESGKRREQRAKKFDFQLF
jgi:hypothetical protein